VRKIGVVLAVLLLAAGAGFGEEFHTFLEHIDGFNGMAYYDVYEFGESSPLYKKVQKVLELRPDTPLVLALLTIFSNGLGEVSQKRITKSEFGALYWIVKHEGLEKEDVVIVMKFTGDFIPYMAADSFTLLLYNPKREAIFGCRIEP
jgi:hypothetical protein